MTALDTTLLLEGFSMRSSKIRNLMAVVFMFSALPGGRARAASVFLVGAELFSAQSSGATVTNVYQYDTNASDAYDSLTVNGEGGDPKSISLPLSVGLNQFTFVSSDGGNLEGPNADLGLFFATTSTSYDPSGPARTADLLASVAAGSTAFFVPADGTSINDYSFKGSNVANGLTTISVDGLSLTFSGFSATNGDDDVVGTFSITVSSVPEPSSLALTAIGGAAVLVCLARRQKKL